MWDLVDYKVLYSVKDDGIVETKISPGILLLVYQVDGTKLPMKLLSIETGQVRSMVLVCVCG